LLRDDDDTRADLNEAFKNPVEVYAVSHKAQTTPSFSSEAREIRPSFAASQLRIWTAAAGALFRGGFPGLGGF